MTGLDKTRTVGAVVIGRNEGQRLMACLESLLGSLEHIVYVDSGSTDNSLYEASERGVDCLSLDLSTPFTAARARNEGATYLLQQYPGLSYIQFVDGDCEVQPQWLSSAQNFLDAETAYAVVCGRRRERYPKGTIYNQLCDIEWNTPIGEAMACGGDALIRVSAFVQVTGYRDDLIAGEEPEMCFRLREHGWRIFRLDEEMTLHDAAIMSFSQWWNRAKRAGYAYASSYYLHSDSLEKFKMKELRSIIFWATVLPVVTLMLLLWHKVFMGLFLAYPLQVARLNFKFKRLNKPRKVTFFYALTTVLAKGPQFLGCFKFFMDKLKGNRAQLIEYK